MSRLPSTPFGLIAFAQLLTTTGGPFGLTAFALQPKRLSPGCTRDPKLQTPTMPILGVLGTVWAETFSQQESEA